jgi:hypothetical protein
MVLVVALGLVAAACGSGEVAEEPTLTTVGTVPTTVEESTTTTTVVPSTTTPVTTTTTVTTTTVWDREAWLADEGPAVLDVIDEYYAAMNDADVGAWSLVRSQFVRPDLVMVVDGVGGRFEHDCALSETSRQVTCTETVDDDLYGPAGVGLRERVTFVADADGIAQDRISCAADDPSGGSAAYLLDLYDWVVTVYPDMGSAWTGNLESGVPGIPCTPYPFRDVEAAQQIVALVPEFLAHSDRWPLETGGSTNGVVAAWEAMASKVERIAADALDEVERLHSAVDEVTSEEMGSYGWFEACCGEPRGSLLGLLGEINAELRIAETLAVRLGEESNASTYVATAKTELRSAMTLLDRGIEAETRPFVVRGMVDSFPIVIEKSVLGCIRACIIRE